MNRNQKNNNCNNNNCKNNLEASEELSFSNDLNNIDKKNNNNKNCSNIKKNR